MRVSDCKVSGVWAMVGDRVVDARVHACVITCTKAAHKLV